MKKSKALFGVVLAGLAIVALYRCGGDSPTSAEPPPTVNRGAKNN